MDIDIAPATLAKESTWLCHPSTNRGDLVLKQMAGSVTL